MSESREEGGSGRREERQKEREREMTNIFEFLWCKDRTRLSRQRRMNQRLLCVLVFFG
jgi:hypothetical protein